MEPQIFEPVPKKSPTAIDDDSIIDGAIYKVSRADGTSGTVRAVIKEEWVETHPKEIMFERLEGNLSVGSMRDLTEFVRIG